MAESWTFDSDLEGWSITGTGGSLIEWLSSEYNTAPGSMANDGFWDDADEIEVRGTYQVAAGDTMSFYARITGSHGNDWDFTLTLLNDVTGDEAIWTFSGTADTPYDTGWIQSSVGTFSSSETINRFYFNYSSFTEFFPNKMLIDDISVGVANAIFYHGLASLAEKFTLPFSGVRPGAFTLDQSLGTVVIGGDTPAATPVIYSSFPYPTGTANADSFPTGTMVSALKYI